MCGNFLLSLPLHDWSEELLSSFQHEGLARPPALAAFSDTSLNCKGFAGVAKDVTDNIAHCHHKSAKP